MQEVAYRFKSDKALCYNDMVYADQWLPKQSPLYHITRLLCLNQLLARKEYYESLYVLRALYPFLQTSVVIYEAAAGHGFFSLMASLLLPGCHSMTLIDRRRPKSFDTMIELFSAHFPFMKCRLTYTQQAIERLDRLPEPGILVGIHACGKMTDTIIALGLRSELSIAVVPCCIDKHESEVLLGIDPRQEYKQVQDATYSARRLELMQHGRSIVETTIPQVLTPYNRVLCGLLPAVAASARPVPEDHPLRYLP